MKLRLGAVLQQYNKLFRKNLIVFLGLPLLVVLGSIFFVNFTPLAQKATAQNATAQVLPNSSNSTRYVVTAEFGRDRSGSDYSSFSSASASDCQLACINDSNCAAYVYNVQFPTCNLKNSAPSSYANRAFITGVKL
ncbi:PAN domain-containing protein [Nostoc flagelliforme]|uniref:PAN domain-containing protein n=1 Tax=Nostoc flagelliforme TaxID=1306274 RepID=UPI000C2D5887|nr:PAN domain-containing protein [Nostoc flagelliforme]